MGGFTVNIFRSIVSTALLIGPVLGFAELVVIANPQMPVTSLSQEEISRIFLGKRQFLANGAKVIPVDQAPGETSRTKFYSDVIRKTDVEMKSYWSRVIFTGQGNPPQQESNDKAVKDLVAKNNDYLGYIDGKYADESIKIVFRAP